MRLVFDVETNGLDDASVIHSLVVKDTDTGVRISYADQPGYCPISMGLEQLNHASVLIGHNILTYDVPTLLRLRPKEFRPKAGIIDTLVCSRLIWPEMKDEDFRRLEKPGNVFPARLVGSHDLESWGYRLGHRKGEFGKTTDWQTWSKEMQDYCEQDVDVEDALWKLIESKQYSPAAIQLEHEFRWVIYLQERHGFRFDKPAAEKLYTELVARRQGLTSELQKVFPPRRIEQKTPAYWIDTFTDTQYPTKTAGVKAGVPAKLMSPGPNRVKEIPFNPGSRDQIAANLTARGWQPTEFTETGKPKIDESTLEHLDFPEAKVLKDFFITEKLIGQLGDGDNAWLRLEKNGRIHGAMNTNGTVTGRCTHFKPNMGQIPSVSKGKDKKVLLGYEGRWGFECRSLFVADPGYKLVGADASGLELRCLAHYMARYDGGEYGRVVCEGDVHTVNQQAAGLATRDEAKTFIYAFAYGAGDHKLGSIAGVTDEEIARFKATEGRRWAYAVKWLERQGMKTTDRACATICKGGILRARFLHKLPAIAQLQNAIYAAVQQKGHLIGLDGRLLHVRSKHSALNTLLQSAGALIVKKGTVILHQKLLAEGLTFGRDFANVAHVHDEVQVQARPELAERVGTLAVESFCEAGRSFQFRVPITGEFKIGDSWAATH